MIHQIIKNIILNNQKARTPHPSLNVPYLSHSISPFFVLWLFKVFHVFKKYRFLNGIRMDHLIGDVIGKSRRIFRKSIIVDALRSYPIIAFACFRFATVVGFPQ